MYKPLLLKSKQIKLEFQSDPKKFKKYHKIKYKTLNSYLSTSVDNGVVFYFNKHMTLSLKQILVILKLLKPKLKDLPRSRVNIQIKLDTTITKKPKDIRMGRGKGAPYEKVFSLKAGTPFFSLYGLSTIESRAIILSCLPKSSTSAQINKYKW